MRIYGTRRYCIHEDAELLSGPCPKSKTGVVKTPTLAAFTDINESHEAGKKAASLTASANAIRSKREKGRSSQQSNNGK